MIQINLIPDVKLDLIRIQKHRNLVISMAILAMMVTLAVVLIVAFYVFGVQTIRDNIANNNIKQEEKNLLQIEDLDKNVTIQNQLSAINKTHEDKLMTSRILGILSVISQKGTPNEVNILSFVLSKAEGTVSLVAQTKARGFEAADIFKKNIEALQVRYKPYNDDGSVPSSKENEQQVTFASDVILSSPTTSQSENSGNGDLVSFNISFKYAKEVFSMKNYIDEIRGLGKGNVTDSYMRLPRDLFKDTDKAPNNRGSSGENGNEKKN